jgi:HEAT repeat protein
MRMKSMALLAVLSFNGGVISLPVPQGRAGDDAPSGAPDVRDLLNAARGVAPTVCALAANGALNGGWGWDAPNVAIHADIRGTMRDLRTGTLDDAQGRALLDALGSDDACVRHMAGTLIGRSNDESFIGPLNVKLESASELERAGAARALGLIGDRLGVDGLVRVLHDHAAPVRANAAWALGRIGERSATRDIASLLRDTSADVRIAATTALGLLPTTDNVDELLRVLKNDENAEVRRTAAWGLGQIGSRTAAEGLAAALRGDKSATVREMSAWALAEIHARDSVDALVAAMKSDESEAVRETAAWGLGELEVRNASDALAQVLASDKSARVRGTAAWAIGELNPGPAPKALVTALRDSDEEVRLKAAWALSQIADPNTANDISAALKIEQRDKVRQALVRGLIETGENSTDVFKDMLDSKDQKTREVAVRALAGRRSPWPWPWPQPRPRPFP